MQFSAAAMSANGGKADINKMSANDPKRTLRHWRFCSPVQTGLCKSGQHVRSSGPRARQRVLRSVQYSRSDPDGANGECFPNFAGHCRRQCRRIGGLRCGGNATRCDQSLDGGRARGQQRRVSTQSLDPRSSSQTRPDSRGCCPAISAKLGSGGPARGRLETRFWQLMPTAQPSVAAVRDVRQFVRRVVDVDFWDRPRRRQTNGWQGLPRLDIHASSKQAAKGRLLMMAALIVISVFALAGACFPSTSPCISNLRQRTRH